ncbi:(2Fe-2S) ferredoxin domain-containing protein [Candidatus Aerophobetes bacterium]|uniref:(2Fe-2S) ferredoxin domain-containing protein n=1 Tax=Aerophobetes bacterium TaxID=2030807 RepID=A0A497E2F8_UNCAE|nr:MAG: (2Fe-2S) ferredoxin domain-containing protein [Candidatus Aerophobetes bacterium]
MKLEELRKIRERMGSELRLRGGKVRIRIVVGMGTSGIAAGAREVLRTFLEEIEKRKLNDVVVAQTGEKGFASKEPLVEIIEEDRSTVVYGNMTPEKARRVMVEHIVNGNVVGDYVVAIANPER